MNEATTTQRVCFQLQVDPARLDEYRARHEAVWPEMLRAIDRIAAKHQVRIGTFGHAGDGNLHPDLVLERGDPNGAAITKAVQDDLYQAALDLGGTVTGEHGIGSARVGWLEAQRGADAVRVMRAIKAALDPQGLLNPGRVLAVP